MGTRAPSWVPSVCVTARERMTTENTPANEVRLYPRFKHTVLCRIEYDGETEAQPWADLDVYSDAEDPRTALLAYLREVLRPVTSRRAVTACSRSRTRRSPTA